MTDATTPSIITAIRPRMCIHVFRINLVHNRRQRRQSLLSTRADLAARVDFRRR
jgi:hypothetical protein